MLGRGDTRARYNVLGCLVAWCLLMVAAAGCGGAGNATSTAAATAKSAPAGATAEATLKPVGETLASGTAVYVKNPSGTYALKLDLRGLEPAHGERQYAVWELESPQDFLSLATYHVANDGRLKVELEPSRAAPGRLERGELKQLLITRVNSDDRLRESITEFTTTGKPVQMGQRILEGTFVGPLVGGSE